MTEDGTFDITKEGHLTAAGTDNAETGLIALTGKMDPAAGNEYMNKELKDITITVCATQDTVESDSFNNAYDENERYGTEGGSDQRRRRGCYRGYPDQQH